MDPNLKAIVFIGATMFLVVGVEYIIDMFAGKCPCCKSWNTRNKKEYGVFRQCVCGVRGQQFIMWKECKNCTHTWDKVVIGEDIQKSGHCQTPINWIHS